MLVSRCETRRGDASRGDDGWNDHARGRVDVTALDEMFLNSASGPHDDLREESNDAVAREGYSRRRGTAVGERYSQLDLIGRWLVLRRNESVRDATATGTNGGDELFDESAADDRNLCLGVALQRVERECNPDACSVAKGGAIFLGHVELENAIVDLFERGGCRRDISLEEWSDSGIGERLSPIGLQKAVGFRRKVRPKVRRSLAPRVAFAHRDLELTAAGSVAEASGASRSAERSTSVIGRRSAWMVSRTPRPVAVTPVMHVSGP